MDISLNDIYWLESTMVPMPHAFVFVGIVGIQEMDDSSKIGCDIWMWSEH